MSYKLHKTTVKGVFYYDTKLNGRLYMYRYRYYDSNKKRHELSERGFKTLKQAERALLKVKIKVSENRIEEFEYKNMTVKQLHKVYYAANKDKWKESTRYLREGIFKRWIIPMLSNYKLREIADNERYKKVFIKKLSDELKPSTIRNIHVIFIIMMNYAVDEGFLPSHKLGNAYSFEYVKSENFLTVNEMVQFEKRAKSILNITGYTAIFLLLQTGLRRAEAFGLQWKDIDFERYTLSVNRIRDRYGVRSPKTRRSVRTIRIESPLIKQLKKYRKWCIEVKLKYKKQHDIEDFIFITPHNTLINENSLNYWLNKIYKDYDKVKRVTAHGLRHSHASQLVNDGIPLTTVAERLGNTVSMIETIYGHGYDEQDAKAAKISSQIFN